MKNHRYINALTECSLLIAMSVVLSLIKIIQMPLGGSVTLVGMLPVLIIPFRHGEKWGICSAFVFALFQLLFGFTLSGILSWGLTPVMLAGCIGLDYLLSYTVLGLSGLFRKKGVPGIYLGILIALTLCFLSHFLSGFIIFSNLEQFNLFGKLFENAPVLYSFAYNALYMIPEMVLTLAVASVLIRIPATRKFIFRY